MVYRATQQTAARKAEIRARILAAARHLVAAGGFSAVQMADVARRAEIATGTVYLYFTSKPDLFAEVFRQAAGREVEQVRAAAQGPGSAARRLADAVTLFTRRAVKGRRLAYSLIAEPVDPAIETERLRFRKDYDEVFRRLVGQGIEEGVFVPQDASVASASIVGALAEALVGPLAPESHLSDQALDDRARAMADFCLRALTGRTAPHAADC